MSSFNRHEFRLKRNKFYYSVLAIICIISTTFSQDQLIYSATGNGQTTGIVAHLSITNPTEEIIEMTIGPCFIPAKRDTITNEETGEIEILEYQSYIITEPITVSIYPGKTKIIAIQPGYCTNIHTPAVPKGVSMPPYSSWIPIKTGQAPPGISENPNWNPQPTIAKNPFDGSDLPGTIDINKNPEIAGPIIYEATTQVSRAVDLLYEENVINTPFSEDKKKERETIIQQTIWIFTAELTGQSYTQDEFQIQLEEQFESNSGMSVEDLPAAQQKLFSSGANSFWSTFILTGENAKIIGKESSTPPSISSAITGDLPPPEDTDPPPPEDPPIPPPEDPPTYYPEEEPVCALEPTLLVEPNMDGGLKAKFKTRTAIKIFRDDFIPLGAEGQDYDQIKWVCIPKNDCPETGGEKITPLTGKVKYSWDIISGEGNFVQLGCLPVLMSEQGDHVVFQPPYVPLEEGQSKNEKTTIILLKIEDDNSTQPIDETVEKRVTIITERKKSNPDYYFVKVKSDPYTLPPLPAEVLPKKVECVPEGPDWDLTTELVEPDEQKPVVPDNDKMVVGQWMRLLSIAQADPDELKIKCTSQDCESSEYAKYFEDEIEWNWEIVSRGDSGKFVTGINKSGGRSQTAKGRYVIYEAPMELEEGIPFKEVQIKITVKNTRAKPQVKDDQKDKTFTIIVYRAGVELERTPLSWLPERDNSLDLLSELKYHDGEEWQDALEHMCRIHFFDLVDDSKELGYCTNAPGEEANDCYDYRLAEGGEHELFNERKRKEEPEDCENEDEYYLEARTKRPVKEHTMTINSEDYGGYGKLFSLANINVYDTIKQRKQNPLYISIPIERESANGKRKKKKYPDNRVTIPRDIDENMIADNGWLASIGDGPQQDPDDNKQDTDSNPEGDGLTEDGYTAYEEYRGFDIVEPITDHVRTDLATKNLMVWNEGGFSLGLFRAQSELSVLEVEEDNLKKEEVSKSGQFGEKGNNFTVYMSNFNSPTYKEYQQAGLRLRDGKTKDSVGGVMISNDEKKRPAPPNWAKEIIVNVSKIRKLKLVKKGFQTYEEKSAKVAAHELGHGCNVYHHGEGEHPEYGGKGGLRSGNVECIMRYDNLPIKKCQNLEETEIEVEVNGRMKTRKAKFEPVGSNFCTNPAGTGYNANDACFGNCSKGRGKCKAQFRVSGRSSDYPKRDL